MVCRAGGGSGGSFLLQTNTLKVSEGSIRVNGGNGAERYLTNCTSGYGGGGGRVALYCDTILDEEGNSRPDRLRLLDVQAYGGIHGHLEDIRSGPGTFYHECGIKGSNHLVVENGGTSPFGNATCVITLTGYSWISHMWIGGASVHFRSDGASDDEVSVLLDEISGIENRHGTLVFDSKVIAVFFKSDGRFSLNNVRNSFQILDDGERRWRSSATFYVNSLLVTSFNLEFIEGSRGVLPSNVFVCQHTIRNYGTLEGVSNIKFCPNDEHGKILGSTDVHGCTDPRFDNYNSIATVDDGSCRNNNASFGCTYSIASVSVETNRSC